MRKSRIVQDKLSSVAARAQKRLMRDLKEIKENPLEGVSALPLEHNIFKWHANLKGPKDTLWENGIFHFEMSFSQDYPDTPPRLTVCSRIPHPNVINDTHVCLDILEAGNPQQGTGWSSAYSVLTILIQLQAFLFESNEDTVTANLRNPSEYKKAREQWRSSVEWAVKQSLTYQDSSVKHHPPRTPWPPLPETSTTTKTTNYKDMVEKELACFYTKQTYKEDCLGVGLTFNKNLRTGEIKDITAYTDFLSLRAFMNHRVRLSANNEKFTHWLPLYINKCHADKAMHLAKKSLSMICTGSTRSFAPEQAVHVLPKLMSSMVVQIMTGKKAVSVRALRGYCSFHRLLLAFLEEYPELKTKVNSSVEQFISDPANRHKNITPNLGEMLALVGVSDFSWDDIRSAYMDESSSRNVFWILSKYPELEGEHKEITDDDRLKYSFEVSKPGSHLLLFHIFFLKTIACPSGTNKTDIAAKYDELHGYPTPGVEDMFLQASEKIKSVEDYLSFYEAVGTPVAKGEMVKILKSAIVRSREKGYHGEGPALVSPEEFASEQAIDLDSLAEGDELIHDEKRWQELCEVEWGFENLPAYLEGQSEPWKRLFLQNHLQDFIEKLNDAPDFKRFYKILDYSKDWLNQLQIDTFTPDNIKSRYHFLTSILTKLPNLTTLIISKGEAALGEKGFKALAKGLASNTGALEVLNLEYCDIDASAIKQLTKGNLVSENLKKLQLAGNKLGVEGVRRLSEFLVQHNVLPQLEELDLSDCRVTGDAAKEMAECLLVKRNLKVLRLSRNQLTNGLSEVLRNLAYSTVIREIDVSKTTGQVYNSVEKLLTLTPSLEVLDFTRCPSLGLNEGFYKALAKNKTLKILRLSETNHPASFGKAIGEALSENTTLKELYLNGNQLTGTALLAMVTAIKESKSKKVSLEKLDLSSNPLHMVAKDKHTSVLGELLTLCPNMVELNLSRCKLSKSWADSIGVALDPKHNLKIRKIDLRQNNLERHGIKPLVEPLTKNTVLEEIDLSGNSLGVLGAKYLSQILEKNTSLKKINVYGNFMEIEGAICVAEALSKNTTLEEIDFGLNRIRTRGAQAISNILASGKCSLKRLLLKSNHINDKAAIALVNGVTRDDSSICHIALAGNKLSDSNRAEVASKLSRNERHITFDLAKLAEVKDPERQERTVYITPLPENTTEHMIKKLFYTNKCGVCIAVDIKKHKVRKDFNSACYAFVTFAHPESIKLATALAAKDKAKISNQKIRIVRAGIENKAPTVKPRGGARGARGSARGGARGASGRARGGYRRS